MSAEFGGIGGFTDRRCKPQFTKCKPQFTFWDAAMFALKNIKSIKYNNSI